MRMKGAIGWALLALLGLATLAQAQTGLPGTSFRLREPVTPMGYPYYKIKWVTAGTGGAIVYDTLRVGRDLNGDGAVDTTLSGAPATSADFVPIQRTVVQWFGSVADTLWVKFLDNSETATAYGSTRIITPSTNKMIVFDARCYRVAVYGGRTNVAGAWLVTTYHHP